METSMRLQAALRTTKEGVHMTRFIMLSALIAFLCACAAPETLLVSTDSATIAAASSFAIEAPPPAMAGAADAGEVARLHTAVQDEITRTLSSKGYRLADASVADLKIAYRLVPMGRVPRLDRENTVAESRVSTGAGDPYGTYRPLAGTGGGERLGMLLLTIVDAKSGATVWQATNQGEATGTSSAVRAVVRGTRAALAKIPAAHRPAP
jgi:hypothetical protein